MVTVFRTLTPALSKIGTQTLFQICRIFQEKEQVRRSKHMDSMQKDGKTTDDESHLHPRCINNCFWTEDEQLDEQQARRLGNPQDKNCCFSRQKPLATGVERWGEGGVSGEDAFEGQDKAPAVHACGLRMG